MPMASPEHRHPTFARTILLRSVVANSGLAGAFSSHPRGSRIALSDAGFFRIGRVFALPYSRDFLLPVNYNNNPVTSYNLVFF
jgi:hypothetical protein